MTEKLDEDSFQYPGDDSSRKNLIGKVNNQSESGGVQGSGKSNMDESPDKINRSNKATIWNTSQQSEHGSDNVFC